MTLNVHFKERNNYVSFSWKKICAPCKTVSNLLVCLFFYLEVENTWPDYRSAFILHGVWSTRCWNPWGNASETLVELDNCAGDGVTATAPPSCFTTKGGSAGLTPGDCRGHSSPFNSATPSRKFDMTEALWHQCITLQVPTCRKALNCCRVSGLESSSTGLLNEVASECVTAFNHTGVSLSV